MKLNLANRAEDTALPCAMSRAYAQAARDAVDHVELSGTGHMEYLDPASSAHSRFLGWLDTL